MSIWQISESKKSYFYKIEICLLAVLWYISLHMFLLYMYYHALQAIVHVQFKCISIFPI